jgi:starvation-inducible DNA-binding protein
MAKAPKKTKLDVAAPAPAGKVPKKGSVVAAPESGSRAAPIINIGIERPSPKA